mmetsp:Transcript_137797/g.239664  ORF Transcript_137797/g.239664 Transcript_137797/m.239664 type:complete len:93 (-) Transcript_137797:429-707(-)
MSEIDLSRGGPEKLDRTLCITSAPGAYGGVGNPWGRGLAQTPQKKHSGAVIDLSSQLSRHSLFQIDLNTSKCTTCCPVYIRASISSIRSGIC